MIDRLGPSDSNRWSIMKSQPIPNTNVNRCSWCPVFWSHFHEWAVRLPQFSTHFATTSFWYDGVDHTHSAKTGCTNTLCSTSLDEAWFQTGLYCSWISDVLHNVFLPGLTAAYTLLRLCVINAIIPKRSRCEVYGKLRKSNSSLFEVASKHRTSRASVHIMNKNL